VHEQASTPSLSLGAAVATPAPPEEKVDWELGTGERLLQPIPSPDPSVGTLSQAQPPPIGQQSQLAAVPAQPSSSTPTTPGSAARTTPRNPKQTTLVSMRSLLSVPKPPREARSDKPQLTLKDPSRARRNTNG
jgi:hypothetical protein